MLRLVVCKDCALSNPKIRREMKELRLRYGSGIEIKKKGCLDACKKDPVVRVGKKTLAPASPRKLRALVAKKITGEKA